MLLSVITLLYQIVYQINMHGFRSQCPTLRSQEVKLSPVGLHVFHAFYQILSYPKDSFLNFGDPYIQIQQKEYLGHINLLLISILGQILQK